MSKSKKKNSNKTKDSEKQTEETSVDFKSNKNGSVSFS